MGRNHSYQPSLGRGGVEIEDNILTATQQEAARVEMPLDRKLIEVLWWLAIAAVGMMLLRVFHLTVIRGEHYQEVARGNKIRSLVIKAPRGKIYDRFGNALVANVPSIDAVVVPADLPEDSEQRKIVAQETAKTLGMNEGEIWGLMESADSKSLAPLPIKQNISQEESLILSERAQQLPGVGIEKTAVRNYLSSAILSHVLGYEGKIERDEIEQHPDYSLTDYIGKQGIEKTYEEYLRGVHGAVQVEVDSRGNEKKEIGVIDPEPGSDLYLNIDLELQKKLFDGLNAILEKTETKTAAAVAINPKNGGVLALVSLPSFDNNLFSHGISSDQYRELIQNPDKPLFNRAISGAYPPGSTLKPVVAAAALSEGVVTQSTIIDGLGGVLRVGNFSFGDWKAHGPSDVRTAIAESNDIFFYTIGGGYGNIEGLGMNRMKKYETLFGLGQNSGIDITGEVSGFIPDEQWKLEKFGERWFTGNSYHAAIGQGFITATPLQLANSIAAIANGGTLYQPKIVSQIRKVNGEIVKNPAKIIGDKLTDDEVLRVVREGMRKTITDGTAQQLNDLPVETAGKTGTAQFGSEDKTHAWFVSFAPYDDPEIAMAVLVEGGGEGHSSAVPVTREVYEWYFSR